MTILKTNDISVIREGNRILDHINLEVEKGDFISITGNSGSGKSTFLKICADLISPDSGDLYFNNKNYKEWDPYELRKKVAYLFQTPNFFFGTVNENLEYPYLLRKINIDRERMIDLIKQVNLKEDILNQQVINLSGGEKQRLSLIRSLLILPEILLLDEVTSALDYENTLIVEQLIKKISEEGVTILWVTHDLEQSRKFSKRLVNFKNGKLEEGVLK